MDSQKAHTVISYRPVVWDHLMEHVERLALIGLIPGHPTADRGVLSIVLQERSLHIAAVKGPTCQVSCWKKVSTNKIMVLSERHCCVAISWFHTTRRVFSIPENMWHFNHSVISPTQQQLYKFLSHLSIDKRGEKRSDGFCFKETLYLCLITGVVHLSSTRDCHGSNIVSCRYRNDVSQDLTKVYTLSINWLGLTSFPTQKSRMRQPSTRLTNRWTVSGSVCVMDLKQLTKPWHWKHHAAIICQLK